MKKEFTRLHYPGKEKDRRKIRKSTLIDEPDQTAIKQINSSADTVIYADIVII